MQFNKFKGWRDFINPDLGILLHDQADGPPNSSTSGRLVLTNPTPLNNFPPPINNSTMAKGGTPPLSISWSPTTARLSCYLTPSTSTTNAIGGRSYLTPANKSPTPLIKSTNDHPHLLHTPHPQIITINNTTNTKFNFQPWQKAAGLSTGCSLIPRRWN